VHCLMALTVPDGVAVIHTAGSSAALRSDKQKEWCANERWAAWLGLLGWLRGLVVCLGGGDVVDFAAFGHLAEVATLVQEEGDAGIALSFDQLEHPDAVLLRGEDDVGAKTFVDVGEHASAYLYIALALGVDVLDGTGGLVDGDGAFHGVDDLLLDVAAFVRVGDEIEDDGGAAGDLDAALVGEFAELEDVPDAGGVGIVGFGAGLLGFGDGLADGLVALAELIRSERLAVLAEKLGDGGAIDEEGLADGGFGFLEGSLGVVFVGLDALAANVFLAELEGAVVVGDGTGLQVRHVGKWGLGSGANGGQEAGEEEEWPLEAHGARIRDAPCGGASRGSP
jgi:hypothetical protein